MESFGKWPSWLVPFLCLLATGSLLGLSTNFAKLAAAYGLGPLPFLAWSLTGAAVLLIAAGGGTAGLPTLTARVMEYAIVSALLSLAAPTLLFFSAVPHVGAGFVSIAIAFPPLLTYIAALALRIEQFRVQRAVGVALALVGAAVIVIPKLAVPESEVSWIVATLVGPVLLAAGNLYRTIRWPPGARADLLANCMVATAAVMLMVVGIAFDSTLLPPDIRLRAVLLIAVQAVAFAVQYRMFFIVQKYGGPVYISLLGSIGAAVGVPVAVFLLGETPPDGLAMSAVLIASGVGLVTYGRSGAAPAITDQEISK